MVIGVNNFQDVKEISEGFKKLGEHSNYRISGLKKVCLEIVVALFRVLSEGLAHEM